MKKRFFTLFFGFLLIIAVFTYASWQNYRNSLPVVEAVESLSTKLHYTWELSGTLRYDKTLDLSVPVPVSVIQRAVQTGDRVSAGQSMLQVDAQQLHLQWLQCKIEEEALEERIEKSDSYTEELLELQLIELQETIVFVENLIAADGWIIADTDGVVLSVQRSQQAAANAPLATIGPDSAQKTICFPLTETQTVYCKPEKELTVTLFCDGESKEVKMPVERVIYSVESEGYQCIVTTDLAVDMMDGHKTVATFAAHSGTYQHVIPVEAIVDNNNGNATFYVLRQRETIMGTEYYALKRTSYIVEQNEIYAAINSSILDPVISRASGEVHDYGTVILTTE